MVGVAVVGAAVVGAGVAKTQTLSIQTRRRIEEMNWDGDNGQRLRVPNWLSSEFSAAIAAHPPRWSKSATTAMFFHELRKTRNNRRSNLPTTLERYFIEHRQHTARPSGLPSKIPWKIYRRC